MNTQKPVIPQTKPPVPTMTSKSVIPPLETARLEEAPLRPLRAPAEELAEDIVAIPLTMPDFAKDIQVYMKNPEMWPRWCFTDRRRYAQLKAQGWKNVTKADLKPGYATLTPYEEEGGTKYINGDLILMMIERKRYLGALKYKHQVAAALSDAAVNRRLSAQRAANDLGPEAAAINRQRMSNGMGPAIQVFTPGAADLSQTVLGNDAVATKELTRIGHEGAPEIVAAHDIKPDAGGLT